MTEERGEAERRERQWEQDYAQDLGEFKRQLAAVTTERDEAKRNTESNLAIVLEQGAQLNDYARQLATAQARVQELEAELGTLHDHYNEVLIRPESDYAQLHATIAAREERIAELGGLCRLAADRLREITHINYQQGGLCNE